MHNKEARCSLKNPSDRCGDNWDHTAIDAEHRLVMSVIPGKRTAANCDKLVADVKRRTGGREDMFFTSDKHAPYTSALKKVYGKDMPAPQRSGPGRPSKPIKEMPSSLCYATVNKIRKKGRVVDVVSAIVFGATLLVTMYLTRSKASRAINTSFVERNNGTDRSQNARKARQTYGFSKDWDLHNAATYFIMYSYNFCWPVRTLDIVREDGVRLKRTPAMAAGISDHVWSIEEWSTYPAKGP